MYELSKELWECLHPDAEPGAWLALPKAEQELYVKATTCFLKKVGTAYATGEMFNFLDTVVKGANYG